MRCIVVDDEPIAREGLENQINKIPALKHIGSFESAETASVYLRSNEVDLIFLDIEMPGINGLEFARNIPKETLVIFTTAYSEYALDSYELDAVDYLVKPIEVKRFQKAVDKALDYRHLLMHAAGERIESTDSDFIFVKSERRYFKIRYEDILFVKGLKDYVIIHTENKRIITKMYLGAIHELLPQKMFFRINKSYIVNLNHIESFDSKDVFISDFEIGIGNTFREDFFKACLNL